jgi:hypothetical protein
MIGSPLDAAEKRNYGALSKHLKPAWREPHYTQAAFLDVSTTQNETVPCQ